MAKFTCLGALASVLQQTLYGLYLYKMNRNKCSTKSYAVAVSLSAIFGFIGIHLFYLRRYAEGTADLTLTAAWIYFFFFASDLWLGLLALALDFGHSFIVTIMLLIGSFKDGEGRIVCYPGQVLT